MAGKNRAVFLDRDGVINELVLNQNTGCYESPLVSSEFVLRNGAVDALRILQDCGFLLFIVSNQPSWAKGKNSRDDLDEIDSVMRKLFEENGITISRCFYCYHHLDSVVEELKQSCECRKPGTAFVVQAQEEFDIDFSGSWFVGDRVTDIQCGQAVGCRTILVESHEQVNRDLVDPDYLVADPIEAAEIIREKR